MTLQISLAQWSLHRTILAGEMRGAEFPAAARREFGIDAVELVNTLFHSWSRGMIRDLRRSADSEGVRIVLIMVDDEGDLCHARRRLRKKATRRHRRWVDAALELGATAIRVNTGGNGVPWQAAVDAPEVQSALARCVESCVDLADYAGPLGIQVLLENHGGLSSNIAALVALVERARRDSLGLLPDFGNFALGADPYAAVERMLPYARAVSAKTYDFDAGGWESSIDYPRMLGLVRRSGYQGYVGIEYEGTRLPERDGVRQSKDLLERLLKP